jgi:hypothetical protein
VLTTFEFAIARAFGIEVAAHLLAMADMVIEKGVRFQ